MAADYYEKDGITYLQCKQCNQYKNVSEDFYYHNQGFLGVLGRCRECIKAGRRTEHELQMARVRDTLRYYNNPKRREYILKSSKERTKRKGYGYIHCKTQRRINQLGIRPTSCPICNQKSERIIAHHPDYDKRYEIVFCCQICHDKIHKEKIECPPPLKLI